MVSTITDRVAGAVSGALVNPGRIFQASSVAGTNTITATLFPTITQYFGDMVLLIRPANPNTGPVTLNLDGVGALPWRTPSGAEHASGDLSTSLEYWVKLNSAKTEFRTISPF